MSLPLPPPSGDAADVVRATHHQVGNSLQQVASLLRLESRRATPEAATVLSEAGRRVRAIMHLHQLLQEGDGNIVRLDDLLGDICRNMVELDAADREAEVRTHIEPLWTDPRTASALAMITAEWVGNALEHGLAERSGIVHVTLGRMDAGVRLAVSDTGVGMTWGDWSPGFGMSLVSRLAAQIGATVTQSVDEAGSSFELVCSGVWSDTTRP